MCSLGWWLKVCLGFSKLCLERLGTAKRLVCPEQCAGFAGTLVVVCVLSVAWCCTGWALAHCLLMIPGCWCAVDIRAGVHGTYLSWLRRGAAAAAAAGVAFVQFSSGSMVQQVLVRLFL